MPRLSMLLALALALVTTAAHATTPPVPDQSDVLGRWQGTYLCTQGWTGLDLTIERHADSKPHQLLEATFAFYEIDKNPGVPSGRFLMRGHYDPEDGHLHLAQDRWLKRPDRYVMVNLSGQWDAEADRISGRISGPGCGGFELRRADGPPTKESWLTGP